jgi:hypothetical protein
MVSPDCKSVIGAFPGPEKHGEYIVHVALHESAVVKGFGCRPDDCDGVWFGGRRRKASSERTRGLVGVAVQPMGI